MSLKSGDKVHIKSVDHPGVVKEVDGDIAGIEFAEYPGAVVWMPLDDIQLVQPVKKPVPHGWLSVGR